MTWKATCCTHLIGIAHTRRIASRCGALPRFYVEKSVHQVSFLEGQEAIHASKALRLKPGALVELCDGKGFVQTCSITDISKRQRVSVTPVGSAVVKDWTGVKWQAVVASGSMKGARGDWMVEKLAELGAYSFLPLMCQHSPRMGRKGHSQEVSGREGRWKCLRDHFLRIENAISFHTLLQYIEDADVVLVAHASGRPLFTYSNDILDTIAQGTSQSKTGCLIIGPEGDFSEEELDQLLEHNKVTLVGLGNLRLRVETAAINLLSGVRMMEQLEGYSSS